MSTVATRNGETEAQVTQPISNEGKICLDSSPTHRSKYVTVAQASLKAHNRTAAPSHLTGVSPDHAGAVGLAAHTAAVTQRNPGQGEREAKGQISLCPTAPRPVNPSQAPSGFPGLAPQRANGTAYNQQQGWLTCLDLGEKRNCRVPKGHINIIF